MTPRERVLACLHRECPDMVPMRDQPLKWAVERWEREGMPEGAFPGGLFENCIDGMAFNDTLGLPVETIKDEGRRRLVRNANGVTQWVMHDANATPHDVDYLIKTRTDWNKLKERLQPDISRVSEAALSMYTRCSSEKNTWLCVSLHGAYGNVWQLIGMPRTLELMAVEPEWFLDIADTYADFYIGMIEILRGKGITLDGIFVCDDITFITGPFFSPAMYRELVMPAAKRLYAYIHDNAGHVYRHTDGNNWKLIPLMIEAGVNFLDPLEVKAGMALGELKEAFDRELVWVGNIDARILYRGDKKEIEEEVKKKLSVLPEGGYIYRLDGPITEEASWECYSFLIECVKKYGRYE